MDRRFPKNCVFDKEYKFSVYSFKQGYDKALYHIPVLKYWNDNSSLF